MLQDELFSEELARNPDFAHLARGRGSGRAAPAQRRSGATAPPPNPFEGVNVMEKLSGMYFECFCVAQLAQLAQLSRRFQKVAYSSMLASIEE
jgi:hypothetical protein